MVSYWISRTNTSYDILFCLLFPLVLVAVAAAGMTRMHTNELVYRTNWVIIPRKFVFVIWIMTQYEFVAQHTRTLMYCLPPINLYALFALDECEKKKTRNAIWLTKNRQTDCLWKTAEIWGAFVCRLTVFRGICGLWVTQNYVNWFE